jgi:uncharacterized protein (DUF1697 family)
MPKYVAFLRAINVGGHIVKMDQLRKLFEALPFDNVETFIASGNVIFDTRTKSVAALEKKIAKHLESSLGYEVTTFIRSVDEIARISAFKPFSESEVEADGNQLYVIFVGDKPTDTAIKTIMSLRSDIDDFCCSEREVYWLYRRKAGESKFYGPLLEKSLGIQATVRNVNTVRRLAKKYGG